MNKLIQKMNHYNRVRKDLTEIRQSLDIEFQKFVSLPIREDNIELHSKIRGYYAEFLQDKKP